MTNLAIIILGLFVAAGKIKDYPVLSSILPIDLTVLLSILLLSFILFKVREKVFLIPREFFIYLPFILIMMISVIYSPDYYTALDKTGRFIFLTGLAIISPFFLLDSHEKIKKFFLTLFVIYFLLSLDSLSMLGSLESDERLTLRGGLTIELGVAAVTAILICIFILLPQTHSLFKKLFLYAIICILFIALAGSGARSAFICLIFGFVINIYFYRKLASDYILLSIVLIILLLFFVPLPETSVNYLESLVKSDTTDLLDWRGHLMQRGIELTLEYPLTGVGIGGFPFYGTIPPPEVWFLYNWPHNVILEISSEMGILNAILVIIILSLAFKEVIIQTLDTNFKYRDLSQLTLALLLVGFITFMNTGDINDNRPMWLYISLPFVLRNLR